MKIVRLFTIALLVIAMIMAMTISAFAADPVVTCMDVEAKDKIVEVTITLSGAPKINSILVNKVEYDTTKAILKSGEIYNLTLQDTAMYKKVNSTSNDMLMMVENNDDMNGKFLVMRFEIKDGAVGSFDYSFVTKLTYTDENEDSQTIVVNNCKGTITIAHDHIWDSGKVTTAATCKADGVKTFTCSICGQTKTEAITKLNHDFGNWEKSDEKNHKRTCANGCNESEFEAHKWNSGKETIQASCTTEGEKTYTCTICQYTKTDKIPALGHSYGDKWNNDKDSHWHDCENGCGEKSEKAAHTYNWTVETEATEDEEGLEKGTCTVCKYETTRAIPKKDHEHKYSEDWLKDEVNHWHECKCGEKTGVAAHTYNWTVEKEATEEAEGLERGICTVCEYETTRAIPKKDHEHKYSEDWLKDEVNHWHECKCGEKSGVAAHTYNWTVEKEATEEAEGLERGTCSVCNYETTRAIPKKDHEHKYSTEWLKDEANHWHECKCGEKTAVQEHILKEVIDTIPTEENDGIAHDECEVCGFVTNEGKVIPALEHTHVTEKVEAKPATCAEEGNIEYYTCIKCHKNFSDEDGEVEIESVVTEKNPANHIGQTRVDGKLEPDCSNVGYTGDTVCVSCGVILIKGEVVPTNDNHNYEWKIDVEPTFEEIGLKHEECTRCGAKRSENTEIPRIECAHSAMQHFDAVRSTCVAQGTREYWYCSECNRKYFDEKGMLSVNSDDELLAPIDPNNHVHTEIRNVKSATCSKEGYTGDTYCIECSALVSSGTVIGVNPYAHSYINNVCEYCGNVEHYIPSYMFVDDDYHLSGGVLARHMPDSIALHTDGIYEWQYCIYCNHEYNKVNVPEDDETVELVVDDPVESGDVETILDVPVTESEVAETARDNNPETGIVVALLPMTLASVVAITSKKK